MLGFLSSLRVFDTFAFILMPLPTHSCRFSHCLVLLLSTVVHTHHSHLFFYFLWLVFGGLSALRLVAVFVGRTRDPRNRVFAAAAVAFLHLVFMLYLHFAYHENVIELEETLEEIKG